MAGPRAKIHDKPARVYPKNRRELSLFLKEIRRRALLAPEEWEEYQDIVSLIANREWKWRHQVHEPLLDRLMAHTGAYFTLQGFSLSS
jgi:hypothetical protein